MLKIRLSRIGKNQYATFRIVVAEHARAVKGKAVEILGSYDPHTKSIQVKTDRVRYWLSRGAHLSPTTHNLFVDQHIVDGPKVTAWKPARPHLPAGTAAGGPPTQEPMEKATAAHAEQPAAEGATPEPEGAPESTTAPA